MAEFILEYWLGMFFSGVTVFGAFLYRLAKSYFKKRDKKDEEIAVEIKILKEANRAYMKDNLYRAYHYYKTRGYIYIHELEVLEDMYKQYKALGGNGTVHNLMKRICELDIREDMESNI